MRNIILEEIEADLRFRTRLNQIYSGSHQTQCREERGPMSGRGRCFPSQTWGKCWRSTMTTGPVLGEGRGCPHEHGNGVAGQGRAFLCELGCARCGKHFAHGDCLEEHGRGMHVYIHAWGWCVLAHRSLYYLKTWWCNLYLNFFSEYGGRMKVFCVQGVGNALRL